MGCPVPKVVNNGEGSALMKDPHLVREIVTSMVKAVKKPVTVKIRKGFNEESANAVEIAKILEDCGVAAIAVHGRTRAQFYSGKADWDIIRRVKEAVSIPVIGNGDVTDAASAEALVEQTGCDGIMIGRGAEGNPWIFKQILHYMETGETLARPTQHEVKNDAPPCTDAGGIQRRRDRHPRDAQACCMVYGRLSAFGKAARGDQSGGEPAGAGTDAE